MSNRHNHPIYRTFEEFEREELRRADAVAATVDGLFEDMFVDELDLDSRAGRAAISEYADDEEE